MAQSAVVRDYRALETGRRRANRLVLTEDLAERRQGLEATVAELDGALEKIRRTAVDQEKVVAAINRFRAVYAELIRLVVAPGRGLGVEPPPPVPRKPRVGGGLR